jgi:signal transduction histidine kinase
MNELGATSIVILCGISAAYLYVYFLYHRRFFVYMALAWMVNTLYIWTETVVAKQGDRPDFEAIVLLTVVSSVSTLFFLLALGDLVRSSAKVRWSVAGVLLLLLAVTTAIIAWPPITLEGWRVEILTGAASLVTAGALIALGAAFLLLPTPNILRLVRNDHESLYGLAAPEPVAGTALAATVAAPFLSRAPAPVITDDVRHSLRSAKLLLSVTLITYGGLQVLYPFRSWIVSQGHTYFISLFWFGLIIKSLHGAVLPLLVMADFRSTAEAVRNKSVAEELGVLTASIEHDIKSPLALIEKDVDNLKRQYQHNTSLTDRLNKLLQHADRIKTAASVIPATRELIENFDEIAADLNVVAVLRSAVAAVKKLDRTGDVRILVEPTRPVIMVHGDKPRLMQAFVNVLNNAVEACREKKRAPLVEVACLLGPFRKSCLITIKDYGIGIGPAVRDQLGKPLFTTKNGQGRNRGIGLFMATRAFRLHHGDINFESDGATYTVAVITLPVVEGSSLATEVTT